MIRRKNEVVQCQKTRVGSANLFCQFHRTRQTTSFQNPPPLYTESLQALSNTEQYENCASPLKKQCLGEFFNSPKNNYSPNSSSSFFQTQGDKIALTSPVISSASSSPTLRKGQDEKFVFPHSSSTERSTSFSDDDRSIADTDSEGQGSVSGNESTVAREHKKPASPSLGQEGASNNLSLFADIASAFNVNGNYFDNNNLSFFSVASDNISDLDSDFDCIFDTFEIEGSEAY
jgi:hypothetical protein